MSGEANTQGLLSNAPAKPACVQQCHEVIDAQARQIESLTQRLLHQEEQLALLQERLKLVSRNSSKPPSSDGPTSNRAQRRASARQRGAQKGHPGSFRALLPEAEVDAVHDCAPPAVCECGGSVAARGKPLRHQVLDVPPATEDALTVRS